jgi:lysine 2,3-aminomutase
VREVILSGGDPMTLADSRLERVLADLRAIEHIEIIRIGTRMPVVCPMRISDETVKMLRRYKPVYLMTHFNHPRELSYEAAVTLEKFVDHGIPAFNQMVLLNGINNHPALVQALSRRLVFLRVKPYYMFQCDPSTGTEHFRTSVEESMRIQRELWGRLSGLAMPNLSLDIPGGGGKVGIVPDFETAPGEYTGWDGQHGIYLAPDRTRETQPCDVEDYLGEWEQIKNQRYGI